MKAILIDPFARSVEYIESGTGLSSSCQTGFLGPIRKTNENRY